MIDVSPLLGREDRVKGSLHLLLLQRWKEILLKTRYGAPDRF